MDWCLSAVIPKLVIFPGHSEEWTGGTSKWLIIETEESITLKKRSKKYLLSSGYIAVGNEVSIFNHSSVPIIVRICILVPKEIRNIHVLNLFLIDKTNSNVQMLMEEMQKTFTKVTDHSAECMNQIFKEIIKSELELEAPRKKALEKMLDPRLISICRMIRKQYMKPLTLDFLSNSINCNPVYFSNTFSKVFNCSPMQYLQRVRVDQASQLLCNTELSIDEITKSVGYISRSQFSSYFKKHYGVTPSEYRRNKGEIKHQSNTF